MFAEIDRLEDTHAGIDLDAIDAKEAAPPSNDFREASIRYLQIISTSLAAVAESHSPRVTAWAICYSLGLPVCEGVSITNRAAELGISPQALSKQVRRLQERLGVNESAYMYAK